MLILFLHCSLLSIHLIHLPLNQIKKTSVSVKRSSSFLDTERNEEREETVKAAGKPDCGAGQ